MWSLKREENKRRRDLLESHYSGGMIVKRVRDIRVVEAASTTLESTKFSMAVAEKEAKEKADLQVKLEVVLKAYNEAKLELASKDSTITELKSKLEGQHQRGESSQLMIASSLAKPRPSNPIIEFPPSPITPSFQLAENIQDEIERLRQAQTIFANKYEEKIRGTVLKFPDTIGSTIVHIHMRRVMSLLDSFKEEKATLEPILDKWTAKEVDLKTIYSLSQGEEGADVIIRPTCELANELSRFAIEGVNIERRENLYRKEYASEKFELFPGGFLSANKIKDKEVWIEELGHKLCQRINNIIKWMILLYLFRLLRKLSK